MSCCFLLPVRLSYGSGLILPIPARGSHGRCCNSGCRRICRRHSSVPSRVQRIFISSAIHGSLQSDHPDSSTLFQQVRFRPKPYYMKKQPDITTGMRAILVDWLVEVGEEYKLRTETLYLAVNFLDRFLSCMSVLRGKLQLVGTAAILLAAKYEEIYPPDVDEFVYITDDTYTKKQLLRMEHLLLKVLGFDLTAPTINQFLLQYIQRHGIFPTCKIKSDLMYLAELSLLQVDPLLKYLPSQIAAAAYCLANYTVNRSFWPETLAAFTGYSLSEIAPCLTDLHKACLDAPHCQLQAIKQKYKHPKYLQVSLLELPAVLPLR
uniref:Cyclin A1 n=1 Tax=Zosterops lateralis melanops TaxID=1220523 RepID=A0A8D2NW57_ZOSLA